MSTKPFFFSRPRLFPLQPAISPPDEKRIHDHHSRESRTPFRSGDMDRLHPSSPPTTTTILTRPTTPSSPVEIPTTKRETAHNHKARHYNLHARHSEKRNCSKSRLRDRRKADDLPPSVAALLAVTSIPPPGRRTSVRRSSKDTPLTVDAIIEQAHVSEKALSLTLGKSPMELLLSAPEDLEDDDGTSVSDSTVESTLSARAVSLESMPSLGDSFSTVAQSSVETPFTPASRRRRPTRMSLEPIMTGGVDEDHPLSDIDMAGLDFRVFQPSEDEPPSTSNLFLPLNPLKSAFKSNLTASLRALRSAAKSFSSLNLTSIPPDDFLTRSLLTLDPQVPYTDERRPPVLEAEPPAALRRYLNPTTLARTEPCPVSSAGRNTRTFTASIQMQTYKVQRSRSLPPPATRISPVRTPTPSPSAPPAPPPANKAGGTFSYPPGPRALRENSDFIRIAVMEMAMRRRGKLSDECPGHARLALPPRKTTMKPYEVGSDGVPLRWVPL